MGIYRSCPRCGTEFDTHYHCPKCKILFSHSYCEGYEDGQESRTNDLARAAQAMVDWLNGGSLLRLIVPSGKARKARTPEALLKNLEQALRDHHA